jgi:hypothetical protein
MHIARAHVINFFILKVTQAHYITFIMVIYDIKHNLKY